MQRIRLLFLLLVLGGLCAFVLPVRDGRPMFSFAEARSRVAGVASGFRGAGGGAPAVDEGVRRVFKWKDRHGVWHYSNRRPADHPEAKEVRIPITWAKGSGSAASPRGSEAREKKGPKERMDPELEQLLNEGKR